MGDKAPWKGFKPGEEARALKLAERAGVADRAQEVIKFGEAPDAPSMRIVEGLWYCMQEMAAVPPSVVGGLMTIALEQMQKQGFVSPGLFTQPPAAR